MYDHQTICDLDEDEDSLGVGRKAIHRRIEEVEEDSIQGLVEDSSIGGEAAGDMENWIFPVSNVQFQQ